LQVKRQRERQLLPTDHVAAAIMKRFWKIGIEWHYSTDHLAPGISDHQQPFSPSSIIPNA